MTTKSEPQPATARLERSFDVPAQVVWELLTSAAALDQWWAPDGFTTRVSELDLRRGGHVRYTMTATGAEQVAYMNNAGLPLFGAFHKTFTEVDPPTRLAYRTLIDFVPGQEPYPHLTTVEIVPVPAGTRLVMTLDALHDEAWTAQYRAHRAQELDHLGAAIRSRS